MVHSVSAAVRRYVVPAVLRRNWGASEVVDRSVVSAASVWRENEEEFDCLFPLNVSAISGCVFASACYKLG